MTNNSVTPISLIVQLVSEIRQTSQDRENLVAFVVYLRTNVRIIGRYEGVCSDLKERFDQFDTSGSFDFGDLIAKLNLLPNLTNQLDALHDLLEQCEQFPELHDKKKIIENGKAVSYKCLNLMKIKDIDIECNEVEQAIEKTQKLMKSFDEDEVIRQKELQNELGRIRESLDDCQDSMWQDDYMALSAKVDDYSQQHLSAPVITALETDLSEAVRKRSEYIDAVESKNSALVNNRHIKDDYAIVRSEARTIIEYDSRVVGLTDRLKEIRQENWRKVFKTIGRILLILLKIVGIAFVVIWSIIKVFLHRDDD